MKRRHISLKTKLAAALAHIAEIPLEHAKLMDEDMILSLFNFDHVVMHAHGGPDEFWNLTPMLIAGHREKTAKFDVPRFAKGERLRRANEEFLRLIATPREDRPVRKSRIQSRGFEKKRKP